MSRKLTRGLLAALLLGATSPVHAQEKPEEKAFKGVAKQKHQDGAQVSTAQLEVIEPGGSVRWSAANANLPRNANGAPRA
jgi:hypothetical protein